MLKLSIAPLKPIYSSTRMNMSLIHNVTHYKQVVEIDIGIS